MLSFGIGHNMQERLEEEQQQQQQQLLLQQQQQQHYSPRNLSAATSPIKDTVRGSQEFTKKLSTSYHGGAGGKAANSSNSSSSFGNIVKEKLGRRSRSSAKEEVNFKKKKKKSKKVCQIEALLVLEFAAHESSPSRDGERRPVVVDRQRPRER